MTRPLTCLLGALAACAWSPARAAPAYSVAELPTPKGQASRAYGLNDAGEAVGTITFTDSAVPKTGAVLWRRGRPRVLGTALGYHSASAFGVNSHGQVAGTLSTFFEWAYMGWNRSAFLWEKGRFQGISPPSGFPDSEGAAVAEGGQVVGKLDFTSATATADTPWDQAADAFTYQNGHLTDIGPGEATCVNERGQVGGYAATDRASGRPASSLAPTGPEVFTALLWEGDKATKLGAGRVNGLNSRGQAVGGTDGDDAVSGPSPGAGHAVLWGGGRVVDLGTLGGSSIGWAVSDAGQVVGTSGDAQGRPRAFLWAHGKMRDLNGLVPPRSGWVLEEAWGINGRGQIVGWGLRHGLERAFMLTPRPTPR